MPHGACEEQAKPRRGPAYEAYPRSPHDLPQGIAIHGQGGTYAPHMHGASIQLFTEAENEMEG